MRVMESEQVLYTALVARDARFDGRFFVGVTSTGIYCRPVCSARTPKQKNCRFFGNAAAAEQAGFRPCRRCRPELAPPVAALTTGAALAQAAAQRIEAGLADGSGLAALAERLGVTDRHLRRIFRECFGVTPIAYAQTQRLLHAKRLLTDTNLPSTEVALASGFGSLRRFNALFQSHYGMAPSAMRGHWRETMPREASANTERGFTFALAYRPPFDWRHLLQFLAARAIPGVERVEGEVYRRSVRLEHEGKDLRGWLEVSAAHDAPAVRVRLAPSLIPALPQVLAGVRRLCDLACEPAAVNEVLGKLAAGAPGLRIPGAFDAFEMSVRAVLGQQITVRAAHTLAGRLVQALGEPLSAPVAGLSHFFPTPQRLANCTEKELGELGIVRQRTKAIQSLALALLDGRIDLAPGSGVEQTLAALQALPGIGPWTAQYIALRALAWPDAWPRGDAALRKALGARTDRDAEAMAEAWRPWRGYATLHLWRRLSES